MNIRQTIIRWELGIQAGSKRRVRKQVSETIRFLFADSGVVIPSTDDSDGVWRTINGHKVFIKKGETAEQAFDRTLKQETGKNVGHSGIEVTKNAGPSSKKSAHIPEEWGGSWGEDKDYWNHPRGMLDAWKTMTVDGMGGLLYWAKENVTGNAKTTIAPYFDDPSARKPLEGPSGDKFKKGAEQIAKITKDYYKEAGVQSVHLYRGVPEGSDLNQRSPLESWSRDEQVARAFSTGVGFDTAKGMKETGKNAEQHHGYVLEMDAPVEAIWHDSKAVSGFPGYSNPQKEVIVYGGKLDGSKIKTKKL